MKKLGLFLAVAVFGVMFAACSPSATTESTIESDTAVVEDDAMVVEDGEAMDGEEVMVKDDEYVEGEDKMMEDGEQDDAMEE